MPAMIFQYAKANSWLNGLNIGSVPESIPDIPMFILSRSLFDSIVVEKLLTALVPPQFSVRILFSTKTTHELSNLI